MEKPTYPLAIIGPWPIDSLRTATDALGDTGRIIFLGDYSELDLIRPKEETRSKGKDVTDSFTGPVPVYQARRKEKTATDFTKQFLQEHGQRPEWLIVPDSAAAEVAIWIDDFLA